MSEADAVVGPATTGPETAIVPPAAGEAPAGEALDASRRPTRRLPLAQLVQISLYALGLNVVWSGWEIVGQERIEEFYQADVAPLALGVMEAIAVVIAIAVQPTVGNISDYTISRWGRRKPYIFIGTLLDVAFLTAIAASNTGLAFFLALLGLQFASNFAQGPFQGYVPDLVPERQVALASALLGMMMIFGNILGTVIITLGFVVFQDYFWPTIALAAVELLTMIGTVLWVQEGSAARPREGKSWATIARETWATDILKERSYVWLVASRFFFLTAAGMFINIVVFYMERTLGFTGETSVTIPVVNATIEEKAFWINVAIVIFAVVVLVVTVPSARASDRVGRKPVIWTACGLGAAGMALATIAPSVAVVIPGIVLLAAAYGIFLAVDWAFMTDIVPKISAGRYMGLSNVATASATAAAPALGGGIIFVTSSLVTSVAGEAAGLAAGPRFAYAASVGLFLVAALLLRPVRDVAHERLLGAHGSGTPQEADRAA